MYRRTLSLINSYSDLGVDAAVVDQDRDQDHMEEIKMLLIEEDQDVIKP